MRAPLQHATSSASINLRNQIVIPIIYDLLFIVLLALASRTTAWGLNSESYGIASLAVAVSVFIQILYMMSRPVYGTEGWVESFDKGFWLGILLAVLWAYGVFFTANGSLFGIIFLHISDIISLILIIYYIPKNILAVLTNKEPSIVDSVLAGIAALVAAIAINVVFDHILGSICGDCIYIGRAPIDHILRGDTTWGQVAGTVIVYGYLFRMAVNYSQRRRSTAM